MYIYLYYITVLIDVRIKKHAQYKKLFIFIIETAGDLTAAAIGSSRLVAASSTHVMAISADCADGSLQR